MTRQCRVVQIQYSACHVTATYPNIHRPGKMTGEYRAPKVGMQIQQSAHSSCRFASFWILGESIKFPLQGSAGEMYLLY